MRAIGVSRSTVSTGSWPRSKLPGYWPRCYRGRTVRFMGFPVCKAWLALGLLAGACAAVRPVESAEFFTAPAEYSVVEWHEASFAAPLVDGHGLYYYPGTRHLLAQGQVAGGRPVGWWRYCYSDGSPLACGEFDSDGRFVGRWLMWTPRGDLNVERHAIRCDDSSGYQSLYEVFPGLGDFEWDLFDEKVRRTVRGIMPFRSPAWDGNGFYEDGFRRREPTD